MDEESIKSRPYQNSVNGFIAWLFGVTGPLLIVLQASEMGNLANDIVASWIFAIYVVGGITTIVLSLYFKQPIAFAFTIPGAVLVGSTLLNHSFTDVLGAYIVTSVLILLISITKSTSKLMELVPLPIMLGMVAGVLLPFGINIFTSLLDEPFINGLGLFAFIGLTFYKRIGSIIPPMLGAICLSFIALFLTKPIPTTDLHFSITLPSIFIPTFNISTMSELVIPLAVTVIAIQNAQGIAILQTSGYKPPIEALTAWSGIASFINSLFGAHSACVAGPMTGIVADATSGSLNNRYKAALVMGALWVCFGLFADLVITLIYNIPFSLVQLLAGLALLNVLRSSVVEAFSSSFKMGALFSFMITLSDFTLLQIGSPFWGLVFGVLFSYVFEREDFQAQFK